MKTNQSDNLGLAVRRSLVWVLGVAFVIASVGLVLMYQELQVLESANKLLLDYWGNAVLSDPMIEYSGTDSH